MRSGRREPELVGGGVGSVECPGATTSGRPSSSSRTRSGGATTTTNGVLSSACDHRHLRDEQLALVPGARRRSAPSATGTG